METKRVPRNTAREFEDNPMFGLMLGLGLNGGGIEAQEAQGQRDLVHSETLPTEMSAEAKAALEALGVKFGGGVEGDPQFQYAELPAGWKKAPTDHSMWSDLLNEKGEKVAAIFYKAAFYDRSAFLSLAHKD